MTSLYGNYAPGVPNLHQENEQTTKANAFIQEIVPRIKGNKSVDLNQLYEFIVPCSGHPDVSRFIQNKLESANSAEKEKIFNGIGDDAVALMKDVYGNYVMQKLLEHGSLAQKARLGNYMRGHMFELSKNMYGCRVVQKAVDSLLVGQLVELFEELREHIEEVMVHTNGNHVIQRAVHSISQQHIGFIFEFCLENVAKLSQDQNGCRVVQRVLEKCSEDERARILNTLRPKWESLIQHNWGNYVVQHVLEHRGPEEKLPIIELVKSNLVRFSKQKLASNVVEACIRFCTNEQRREILQIFLTPGVDGTDTLLDVAGDQYGNYVISKHLPLLFMSEFLTRTVRLDKKLGEHSPPENQMLLDELRPRYEKLRTANNVMPKVLSTLGRVVEDASQPQNGAGRLQVEVDSAAPTPVLTNETNSPQSDGPLSANASAIGVPSADMKTSGAPLQFQDHEA
jgi:mRNA-binding protein PUF3